MPQEFSFSQPDIIDHLIPPDVPGFSYTKLKSQEISFKLSSTPKTCDPGKRAPVIKSATMPHPHSLQKRLFHALTETNAKCYASLVQTDAATFSGVTAES